MDESNGMPRLDGESPPEAPNARSPEERLAPEDALEPAGDEGTEAGALAEPPAEPSAPPPPEPVNAGAYVASALRAAGVRYAFTVPGESFLPLLESLESAGIHVVATRHEGGAGFMAAAYGQLTGRPAAALVSRGPGVANLSIGLHAARQDSSPVFAVVGQVERSFRGREAFQEVDVTESFGRLAKWAVEVDRADALPGAMEEATKRALSGRPGPVVITLPEDLLDETVSPLHDPIARRSTPPTPDPDVVRGVLHLLTDARRPLILAGGGVLRARTTAELVRLAETLEVPVIAAWRRPDVFPNDHPLFLGTMGLGAPSVVRERLAAADGLLVLGSRLNEATTHDYRVPARDVRWAHVDLEPLRSRGKPSAPTIALTADARAFLRAAREALAGVVHLAAALDERRTANAGDRAAYEAARVVDGGRWDGPGVHPGRVIETLRRLLPADAILTNDAGNFSGWAARGFRFLRPGTFIGSSAGPMGFGLPAAIAASLVHRDRPVVALCGDGGFAMTMAELETAVRERVRPIVLVFDNGRFGTIRAHQERRGTGVGVATDLGPIDAATVARGMGAHGIDVDDDAAFEPALTTALASDRPTVIRLRLDPAWVSVDRPAVGT